ncbi:MAG: biotin--[acetyl-CoA-carboxylase] ligase [Ruminococcus sp.]|jgi:BirA family biotin operon repressor/biotin-[acetyl-CoA-carboxylase] ligase|nr:biotin--[acetyl-CoA-carboxylase] ligase [Ruminococcus sp.]
MKNPLTPSSIARNLKQKPGEIIVKSSTASTNDDAKTLALSGAPCFTAVLSQIQTNGRGQHGRGFVSDRGGLFLSVIVGRGYEAKNAAFITLCAAVAVMKAVERISGIRPKIKWINDLLVDGRKICGILTESRTADKSLEFAVVGIGLNVNNETFPPEIAEKAASLYGITGEKYDLNLCAAAIINALYDEFSRFETGEFLKVYRENLTDPSAADNIKFN